MSLSHVKRSGLTGPETVIKPAAPSSLPGATYHFMASKDDDNTPISSSIPGPQHEGPIGSVQTPMPLAHPPPSPTYSITIDPQSMAPPSIPLPRPQNTEFTGIADQKQKSSWYPSIPHSLRRSPDTDHPVTPFIPPLSSLSGSFPNTSAGWGPANSQVIPEGKAVRFDSALPSAYPISTGRNRHSSWDPSTAHAYRGRPNLNDQETQSHPNTPFISPLSPPSGPSFYTPNHWGAGVSADYHNSGWSPADDRRDRSHSHAGAAFRYGAPADYHNSGWSPADDRRDRSRSHAGAAFRYGAPAVYPMLRSPGNDREWVTPSGAGAGGYTRLDTHTQVRITTHGREPRHTGDNVSQHILKGAASAFKTPTGVTNVTNQMSPITTDLSFTHHDCPHPSLPSCSPRLTVALTYPTHTTTRPETRTRWNTKATTTTTTPTTPKMAPHPTAWASRVAKRRAR